MKTPSTRPQEIVPPQFESLSDRLKEWRTNRQRGQRIPESIWKAAVRLARAHGLNATASALKLNYYDLQRRLGTEDVRSPRSASESGFIELAAPAASGRCEVDTLELVRACGSRVILRLGAARSKELRSLVQLFLRQRS